MLKGIDPRLNADVLYALRAMGHGDGNQNAGDEGQVPQQTRHPAIFKGEWQDQLFAFRMDVVLRRSFGTLFTRH